MKKVVVNEALYFLKQRRKLKSALGVRISETDLDLVSGFQPSDGETPETKTLTPEELHQLISELPDGCRTVLNLYVFEGYSHKQIAEALNIGESTSASQLYYARQLLIKRIKELNNCKR